MPRTETQSAETDAPVADVLAVLTDAARIPQWAPAFADEVSGDSRSGWLVTKDGQAFALRVAAVPAASTVDYLREVAPGREGGAYLRVVPRPGGGSVIIMTLPGPSGADPAGTAAVLAGELAALAALAASS
jgi:Polyketide cyclase / dehydrase and lipid transport